MMSEHTIVPQTIIFLLLHQHLVQVPILEYCTLLLASPSPPGVALLGKQLQVLPIVHFTPQGFVSLSLPTWNT